MNRLLILFTLLLQFFVTGCGMLGSGESDASEKPPAVSDDKSAAAEDEAAHSGEKTLTETAAQEEEQQQQLQAAEQEFQSGQGEAGLPPQSSGRPEVEAAL